MIAGLRLWEKTPSQRGKAKEQITHDGWSVQLMTAGLGVVGFIFEGRPNVFADATGVLRSGNTVVFRIGSDALLTANAIVEHALEPALKESGLPSGSVSLIDSAERSAGYAMFSDQRLALAVARGSGPAAVRSSASTRCYVFSCTFASSCTGTGKLIFRRPRPCFWTSLDRFIFNCDKFR